MKKKLDINSDLGEGGGFDAELMRYINSCNIACGGHYGSQNSMEKTIDLALENKVNIGAHPAYPDKENFGRKPMEISSGNLRKTLEKQLSDFSQILSQKKAVLHHIKPHGALYNDLKTDAEKAELLVAFLAKNYPNIILFVPPESAVEKIAKGRLTTWQEGFADRNYNYDLSLVSRQNQNAVITDEKAVLERMQLLQNEQKIETLSGKKVSVNFDTICVHGDTENAVNLVKKMVDVLTG
jgi:UPF0271 protein